MTDMGVSKQFPKVKAYLKKLVLGVPEWETVCLSRLERYVNNGAFEFRYAPEFGAHQYDAGAAAGDLGRVIGGLRWRAIHAALDGADDPRWFNDWQRSCLYAYWQARMEYATQVRVWHDFSTGVRPQYLPLMALHRYGFEAGNCMALGWSDCAEHLARKLVWLLEHDGFTDSDDVAHRRTQYFVFRLLFRRFKLVEPRWPACAVDTPLFNDLLEKWDAPDWGPLAGLLVAACDRHTHQARPDSNKGHFDLPWLEQAYMPFEVLSVMRLREHAALPCGPLNHVLLDTPLGTLRPRTEPVPDDLLLGLISRVRSEIPDV